MSQSAIILSQTSGNQNTIIPQFSIKWKEFDPLDSNSVIMSASEFRKQFLYGIPLCNNVTGQKLTDADYEIKIRQAQKTIEEFLCVKMFRQAIFETKNFVREEYGSFGFIKTSWPVHEICSVTGSINNAMVVTYPQEWLSIKQSNSNANDFFRQISIIPNGAKSATLDYLSVSYSQYFTFHGARFIPNYWKLKYITGFDVVPEPLKRIVGILTAIDVLPMLQNIVGETRNTFGSSGTSLSMDGLSQSRSKMGGGDIFANRIRQYQQQYDKDIITLKGVYRGISYDVC